MTAPAELPRRLEKRAEQQELWWTGWDPAELIRMWRDLPETKQRELLELSRGAHQWRQARQQIMEAMIQHAEARQQTMEAEPFAVRKDGRGSDRRSEDQAPSNQKLKILKAKLEEDHTSTGKTRKKKVCDPENDQESELQRQGGNLPQTPETPEKMLYDPLKSIAEPTMRLEQRAEQQEPAIIDSLTTGVRFPVTAPAELPMELEKRDELQELLTALKKQLVEQLVEGQAQLQERVQACRRL